MSLFGKLLSNLSNEVSSASGRGMMTSSVPNYIKGHYGPTQGAKDLTESVVPTAAGISPTLGVIAEKAILGGDKLLGQATTGIHGLTNAAKMQLPSNRAVYRETGINKPLFDTPILKTGVAPASQEKEIVSRALANRHIAEQAGQVPENKQFDEILKRAGYESYTPMNEGFYVGQANKYRTKSDQHVTKKEAQDIEKHITNVWKSKTFTDTLLGKAGVKKKTQGDPLGYKAENKFLMKRARGKGGDHWDDFQRASQVTQVAKQIFGKGRQDPKTVDELADELSKVVYTVSDNKGNMTPKKGLAIVKKDKDGVWFEFSRTGSAITEGGVNFLVKMKPNGQGFSVMSDEHNFLEKLPMMSKLLPNRVLAATPPMHFNIKTVKPMQTGGKSTKGRKATKEVKDIKQPTLGWKTFGPEEDKRLADYIANLKPQDRELLKREQLKAFGKLGTAVGAGGMLLKEDD